MTKLNTLGVYLGQILFVTENPFDSEYTPNVHKERVLTVTETSFYTANSLMNHSYTKQYNIFTGVCIDGNSHFKAYTSEKDYLKYILNNYQT